MVSIFPVKYVLTRPDGSLDRPAIRAKARDLGKFPEYRQLQCSGNFSLYEMIDVPLSKRIRRALGLAINERETNARNAMLNDRYAKRQALIVSEAIRIAEAHGFNIESIQHEITRRSFGSFATTNDRDDLPLYRRALAVALERSA